MWLFFGNPLISRSLVFEFVSFSGIICTKGSDLSLASLKIGMEKDEDVYFIVTNLLIEGLLYFLRKGNSRIITF